MTCHPSSSSEDYKHPDQKSSQCPCGKGDFIRVNDVKKQMDEHKKAMEKVALKEMGSQKIKQESQNKAIEKLLASVPVKEEAMPNEQDRIVNGYVSKTRPWVVTFEIKGEKGSVGFCAGTLVNHRFVMWVGCGSGNKILDLLADTL